ncbi:MAG: hypothetical protein QM535_14110 [Limnohabitans sp.]|nr:hypothetical protein [Limnohabitans sp.]
MKNLFLTIFLLASTLFFAQSKKMEATNNQTGKSVIFEEGMRVKVITLNRQKYVGAISFKDADTFTVDGNEVKLANLSSIKYFPKGDKKAKKILFGIGGGLIVSSGVAGLAKSGSAFALFTGGLGTAVVGALVDNKNKNLVYRNYTYKIIE